MSIASFACSLPAAIAASRSRQSDETSEIPWKPHCLFIKSLISSGVIPVFFIMNGTTAGSISPQRVPMITPASGVKPIEVSITFPSLTAEIDEPLPRWQVTIFVPSAFPPISLIISPET